MTVAQLIQALQELVEGNKDAAYMDVRWEYDDGFAVSDAYVAPEAPDGPVVVIY